MRNNIKNGLNWSAKVFVQYAYLNRKPSDKNTRMVDAHFAGMTREEVEKSILNPCRKERVLSYEIYED